MTPSSLATPNWLPFNALPPGTRVPTMRSAKTKQGVLDRLCLVAFAELQAKAGFEWAIHTFSGLPETPRNCATVWAQLRDEEFLHYQLLLGRIAELGGHPAERPLPLDLWESLTKCQDARAFTFYMSRAEERGKIGGEKLSEILRDTDPVSADLFGKIAADEVRHIAIAAQLFPVTVS